MSRHAPNRAARSLVTRRTETGALVVSGVSREERNAFTARVPSDLFFGRVVTGVVDCLRPRSTHPLLMFADSAQTRQQALNELRQDLVVSTHADDPLRRCSPTPVCPRCSSPGRRARCRSAMSTWPTGTAPA